LPFGTRESIQAEVRKIQDLFGTGGGIILGPSHEIPNDVPIENIVAMYSKR
jgi:uroporphyrinogen decarboxylase